MRSLQLIHWGGWHGWRRGSLWWNGRPLAMWSLLALLALPAAGQDARRWKIEEAVSRPQSCWKDGTGTRCVPLSASSADPFAGARRACAGIADGAAAEARWGRGFLHRHGAACNWATGEWSHQSRDVVKALVGDPSYEPLCVERLDAIAACNQGVVASTAIALNLLPRPVPITPCTAIRWNDPPTPEWVLTRGAEVAISDWDRAKKCCWKDASTGGIFGAPAQYTRACLTAVEPPPPRCGDGRLDPGETCATCPQDMPAGACVVEPPEPPSEDACGEALDGIMDALTRAGEVCRG